MGVIYDFYATDTWLDSCDSAQFAPARLLAILAQRWPNVRMVVRGPGIDAVADDFSTWLMSV